MNGFRLFMQKKMQANIKEWNELSDKDRMEYDSMRVQTKKEYFENLEKYVLTLPQEEAAEYQSELAASKVPSTSRNKYEERAKEMNALSAGIEDDQSDEWEEEEEQEDDENKYEERAKEMNALSAGIEDDQSDEWEEEEEQEDDEVTNKMQQLLAEMPKKPHTYIATQNWIVW